jgi:uncharacterized cupin superfamily protein
MSNNHKVIRLEAGDAFFIPMGTICKWQTNGNLKKFYSILDPVADSVQENFSSSK